MRQALLEDGVKKLIFRLLIIAQDVTFEEVCAYKRFKKKLDAFSGT